jgi:uncharacterized integral membrane protein
VSTSEVQYDQSQPPVSPEDGTGRRGRGQRGGRGQDGVHGTRIGSAWVAVVIAVVLGLALVDFIVQNTRSVRIEFFSANGHIPVAVALIGAALVGAFIVLAVGVARTTQLRIANRRGVKREKKAASLASSQENSPSAV